LGSSSLPPPPSDKNERDDRKDGKRHNASHHTYTYTQSTIEVQPVEEKSDSPPTIAPTLVLLLVVIGGSESVEEGLRALVKTVLLPKVSVFISLGSTSGSPIPRLSASRNTTKGDGGEEE